MSRQKDKSADRRRLTFYFNLNDNTERLVYNYLSNLPYGGKTDMIVTAITNLAAATKEQRIRADGEQAIQQELLKKQDELSTQIEAAMKKVVDESTRALLEEVRTTLQQTAKDAPPPPQRTDAPKPRHAQTSPVSIDDDDLEDTIAALDDMSMFFKPR